MSIAVVTVDAAGSSAWIPSNRKQTPFNIGMGIVLSAGAVLNYTVEHTFDNIQKGVTPTPFPNSGLTGKSVSDDGNYAFPVFAVRLTVNTHTGGDATLTIIQGP